MCAASIWPPALPKPFHQQPSPNGIEIGFPTQRLVEHQVDALLAQTPSFTGLAPSDQQQLKKRLVKVGAYAAALVRDDWAQSQRIGQRPLIKRKVKIIPKQNVVSRTLSASDDFAPAAANQVARVTQETLRAIAFPTFVADLIKGTFQAIVNASIQQMQAFMELLENVSKTVEEFEADNITDNQARDWLTARYPQYMRIQVEDEQPRIEPTELADEGDLPDFRRELNLSDAVAGLDSDTIEELLVPAARRRLAQSRLQMLSTLVMMGLQRIVVKHGRIRATMGFHIDATDRAHRVQASLLDTTTAVSAAGSFLSFSASASTSITYVRSTQADSDSALNVQADLTGEVDITFESDYMPLNRVASSERIEEIRANTPVPEQNQPQGQAVGASPSPGPSASQMIQNRLQHRQEVTAPELPPIRQPESQPPESPVDPARQTEIPAGESPSPEPAAPSRQPGDPERAPASGGETTEPPAGETGTAPASEETVTPPSAAQSARRFQAMA